MRVRAGFSVIGWGFWLCAASAWADYSLLLKNGRRIIVQSYRQEGGIIMFRVLGGEIGIPRDEVQALQQVGAGERAGLDLSGPKPFSASVTGEISVAERTTASNVMPIKSAEERLAEERAKEEKGAQQKIKDITEEIKQLRERYAEITRGKTGSDPNLFTSEEAFRGHQQDIVSRLKDADRGVGERGVLKMLAHSPFSGLPPVLTEVPPTTGVQATPVTAPPAAYTEKERELSDLRNQISQLEKERLAIIEEMKQKNFDTGSLFLE